MRHPAVRCLSHPNGRIINHRPPNALDLERALEVALETASRSRRTASPTGSTLRDGDPARGRGGRAGRVSTDAHSVRGLGNMRLAVRTARRGWATAADVLNTRPLEEVLVRRS